LLRLEILLAHLPFEHRGQVAAGLQLPIESIDRLNDLAMAESELFEALSKCELPSQVVQVLNPYAPALLILVAVRSVGEGFQSKRAVRKMIWRYLTQWSLVKSPLDGKDLKALGYQPDRQFKQILKSLTNATLDGKIRDRAQAQAFLQQTFPLFLKPTE
jgi:tRNA nucleotidyltransferase (CCA-adding enzyme)